MDTAPEDRAHERFELRGHIGTGGVGVVFRAWDRARGAEVALKTLHGGGDFDLYRLKREFRALVDIAHPNLVRLHELHTDGRQWFFTMELIEGLPLVQHLRAREEAAEASWVLDTFSDEITRTGAAASVAAPPGPPRDWDHLEALLYQLADAVQALHVVGKLHRDLKPSNVLVEPSGRVVLLDFGLVWDLDRDDQTRDAIVGTPSYMSPEQVAHLPPTPASDWYSVGVILYEAITGRRPFEGAASEVMTDKVTLDPIPARYLAPDVPEHLDRLCTALLQRDPAHRIDGAELMAALGRSPSPCTQALARTGLPFVGRDVELAALRDAAEASRHHAVTAVIDGAPGAGTSTLLRQAAQELSADGALVLEGRCREREALPYGALDGVVDALTAFLQHDAPERIAALEPSLAQVGRLFPVLRRIPALSLPPPLLSAALAEPAAIRRAAFAALGAILDELGRDRQLAIVIDDLQWADADGAALLHDLITRAPNRPVLWLLGHQRLGGGDTPFWSVSRTFAAGGVDARSLPLESMSDHDAIDLWRRVADDARDADAIRRLVAGCRGNPYLLTEAARIDRVHGGTARDLGELLGGHLAGLTADGRALLEVVATAGRPLSLGLAARAADIDAPAQPLALLRAERLVRLRCARGQDELEPCHGAISQAVLAAVDGDRRRAIHRAVAEALEDEPTVDHAALVEHWLEAGDLARSRRHAWIAASTAEDALAFHQAARYYQLALEAPDADDVQRRRVHTRLGQVLVYAGRLDEAADHFAHAGRGADPDEGAELLRLEIEQRLRSGQRERAMAGVHRLLDSVGCRLPRSPIATRIAAVGHAAAARVASLRRRTVAPTPALDQRMRILASLSLGLGFVDPVLGRILHLRLERDALASGLKQHLGVATALGLGYLGSAGRVRPTALDEARRRGLALAAELDDPVLEGWVLGGSGLASYLSGRWRDARDQFTRGREVLDGRSGDVRWLLDIGEIYSTAALWLMGDTAELVRVLPGLLHDAQERGDWLADRRLRTWRSNAAWLVLDGPDEAEYQIEATAPPIDGEDLQLRHFYELLSRGQIDLYRRDGQRAHALVSQRWPELERSLLLRVRPLRIEAWFLRGRCALAASSDAPGRLHIARRACRVLERERSPHTSAYAAALRATVWHQQGRDEAACDELRRAATLFADADMALFAAAAHIRVGCLVGGDEGAALAIEAAAAMTRGAVVDPAAMTEVLLPGWSLAYTV